MSLKHPEEPIHNVGEVDCRLPLQLTSFARVQAFINQFNPHPWLKETRLGSLGVCLFIDHANSREQVSCPYSTETLCTDEHRLGFNGLKWAARSLYRGDGALSKSWPSSSFHGRVYFHSLRQDCRRSPFPLYWPTKNVQADSGCSQSSRCRWNVVFVPFQPMKHICDLIVVQCPWHTEVLLGGFGLVWGSLPNQPRDLKI